MKKPLFPPVTAGAGGAGRQLAHDRAASEASRHSELAARYEELLDQVWRCEREWRLDDRISFACRRRRG